MAMDETEESFARTRAEIKAFEKSIGNDPIKLELLKVDFWIATLTPGDGMADFRDSAKLLVQSPNQEEKGAGDSDEYVCDNENENSRVREDESTVASGYDQPQFIRFLERLNAETVSRHHAPHTGPIPGLKQDISLFHHQQHAVAAAIHAKDSPFKGMILTDPYGRGKTLSALATIALSAPNSTLRGNSCVIVAPLSCCDHWMVEIAKFFGREQMPSVYIAEGSSVNPLSLYWYKIVVTSYSYVAAEITRARKYAQGVAAYKEGKIARPPYRPWLILFSGLHDLESQKPMGQWLVLDEAHAIKNRGTRTYDGISELRRKFDSCLMITATPAETKLDDAYALTSMLRGHPESVL